jgi:Ca-activated chloride channel family protein
MPYCGSNVAPRIALPPRRLLPSLVALWLAAPVVADVPAAGRAVFRGGVDLVHLHVTVTDGQDHSVTGLREQDFAVFEDGVPQRVAMFNGDGAPLSVLLMIDGSGSMDEMLPAARLAAERVLSALRPGDRARVVAFNDRDSILQDFTEDRRALSEALARVSAGGATALYRTLYVALKDLRREKKDADNRRLAMVLLTDGLDTASSVTDDQLLELARGGEVSVYPISLRPHARVEANAAAFSAATYFLSRLASDTGGRAFFAGSAAELDGVYARIAAEMRAQYSLAYAPTAPAKGWRRILVRTPGRSNLQVRHRQGYYSR